jgi:ketosteroid isomerase-like protein
MAETRVTDLRAAFERFYEAMRAGDIDAMSALWSRRRIVSCTHPNRRPLFGFPAVMEGWRVILGTYEPPRAVPRDVQIVVTGSTALVLCREDLGDVQLMASKGYALEADGWKLLSHQSAHIPVIAES